MLTLDKYTKVYRAMNISDLLETEITNGGVFHVYARPMFMPAGRCLTMRVALITEEGTGKRYEILMANNPVDNIPTQVELALMDLDCLPTWGWDKCFSGEAYQAQFARSRNPKVIADSGAYRFEKVLLWNATTLIG